MHGDAVAADVLTEDSSNQPYLYNAYVGDRQPPVTPVSQIDFTAPGADWFFGELLSEAIADGHDGWMEDFGEYTPLDAVSRERHAREQMHNLYPGRLSPSGFDFAQAQEPRDRTPHPLGLDRGCTLCQIVWGGDPMTDWGSTDSSRRERH